MKKSLIILMPVIALNLLWAPLVGAKWVKLTPAGEKVRVLESKEVTTCKKLGKTTVSLKDNYVLGIKRGEKKVKKELAILGRNSAADIGGDTIVATTEPSEGKQSFAVYKCVNPGG
ncbi:MAG: DUF4156 domain-containing protein [Acidiferrobacterales bacterium]